MRAVFFGLGSDGTVGANKNTIKILGAEEGLHAQGYFVYDSKKSGSQTVSHLRFGPQPIRAPYLVQQASFVGCHQFGLLDRVDVLGRAAPRRDAAAQLPARARRGLGRAVRARSRSRSSTSRSTCTRSTPAGSPARSGLAGRINIVLQTCFFAISGVLPARAGDRPDQGRRSPRPTAGAAPRWSSGTRPRSTARSQALHQIEVPGAGDVSRASCRRSCRHDAPEFVRTVTAEMMAGRGDDLPVSALPVDGTYPSGTTAYEKRNISELVAVWDPDLCIQCGNCSFVCPHSVIRSSYYDEAHARRRAGRRSGRRRSTPSACPTPATRCRSTSRTAPAAGCASRPARSRRPATRRTRRSTSRRASRCVAAERDNIAFFETLPATDRSRVDFGTVRGTQFLEPLFEFSGACAGCGETPYLKLLSQLFGDRLMVANATGCSSIYGGNLPTTPWTTNADGRGPAWSNSLFEDNAEFGLGFRLAADRHTDLARRRLAELRDVVGAELVDAILAAPQLRESELRAQRERVAELRAAARRAGRARPPPTCAASSTTWSGAASGSSAATAGPTTSAPAASTTCSPAGATSTCSCSTPRSTPTPAARCRSRRRSARSPSSPRPARPCRRRTRAAGDRLRQRLRRPGRDGRRPAADADAPSARPRPTTARRSCIAYSHCIAHGIEMRNGLDQQYRAVASGYWPLIRYDPMVRAAGGNPFLLDSPRPRIPLADYTEPRAALPHAHATPTRPRPSGCTPWPSRRSTSAGTSTRRWRPAARSTSPPTRGRSADGPLDPLPGPGAAQPARRLARPRSRRPSTACGGWPTRASARSSSTRCSRSSCAARRPRTRGSSTPAPRASPSRSPTSPPTPRTSPGPRRYLSLLERAAAAVDVPVIGSLNGVTPGGWAGYARAMQDAGAAAIELNIYYLPGDPHISGRDVEQRHVDILQRVKDAVTRAGGGQAEPVLQLDRRDGAAARRGRRRRARAVQPVPAARHRPRDARRGAAASASRSPAEARLPRTWIALLHGRVRASLAATTGVETAADVAKYLLAGADVVMTASALLRHGPEHAPVLLDGLSDWMARKGFARSTTCAGCSPCPPAPTRRTTSRRLRRRAARANSGIYEERE